MGLNNASKTRLVSVLAGIGAFYLINTFGISIATRPAIFAGPLTGPARVEILNAVFIIGAGFAGFTAGWITRDRGYLYGFIVATILVLLQFTSYFIVAFPRSIWETMGGDFYAPAMVRTWFSMAIIGPLAGWSAEKLKIRLNK